MAHVQAKRRKAIADLAKSVEKENIAPAKGKKTVSISGIFDRVKKHQPYDGERGVLSPRPAGVSKAKPKSGFFAAFANPSKMRVAEPGFFKKFTKGFSEPIAIYQDAAATNFEQRMAQWRKELDLRRDGLDPHGKPIRKAPVPTRADIDALSKELEDVLKPIDEEVLHLEDAHPGGETKTQKLADTVTMLQKRIDKKTDQISKLEKEQRRVDQEIEEQKAELLGEGQGAAKLKQDYDAQLAILQQEVGKAEARAKNEVEEMKRTDREAKKRFDRKVQALWDGEIDDE